MEKISRRTMIVGGAAALSAAAALAQTARQPGGNVDIDQAVTKALSAHACPGVSVVVSRTGEIVYSQGYGFANIETQSPVSDRTVFRVGSLTKQFTAAAIIKLAAMGRLNLKASTASYLPTFRSLKPFTLLELMNHTAGLHSDENDAAPTCSPATQKTQIQLAEEISKQEKPFDFDPGTAWLYSNANYIVLGAVIENVTRTPLAQALSELIFVPLNLRSAAMDRSSEVVLDRASGYNPTHVDTMPFENAGYIEVSEAGGAGALRANAIDLCRWHEALLGEKLFDRAHINTMLAPGRLRDGRPSSANRFSAEDAHYGDVQYACGLLISGSNDLNPSILHYGDINGFAVLLQTYREKRVTFAALCNGDNNPELPFRGIRNAVISRYLV